MAYYTATANVEVSEGVYPGMQVTVTIPQEEASDVVVLRKAFGLTDGPIVKRIVATGGQRVEIDYGAGTVTVDGQVLCEPYIKEAMAQPWYENLTAMTVPEGCVFVLGDNRNGSNDSRDPELGTVDARYVLGRAVLILAPLSDFGLLPTS